MKRVLVILAAITMSVCLLAACGEDTAEVSLPPSPTAAQETPETTAEPSAEPTENSADSQTAAVLAECISLLGMDDAESAGALGGSEQNIAADGETLIGRIYSAELFGESVEPGTTYGDDGRVNSVSIYLAGTDAAVYAEVLTRLYGEPAGESDGVSESGSTWQDWTVEGARVRLYQSYGLSSLEITAA